jgi:hypothetical protein
MPALGQDGTVEPDFAPTLRPGCSKVPFAERVMFLVLRSSITTTAFAAASRAAA